jgi:hypothetical protein
MQLYRTPGISLVIHRLLHIQELGHLSSFMKVKRHLVELEMTEG